VAQGAWLVLSSRKALGCGMVAWEAGESGEAVGAGEGSGEASLSTGVECQRCFTGPAWLLCEKGPKARRSSRASGWCHGGFEVPPQPVL
jgi:hypothetical protein